MNILPHKSWHVRTKKNIARVRKDEAQAAEEEKERQRKIALAAQESRTAILRERASKRLACSVESASIGPNVEVVIPLAPVTDIVQNDGHVNFFQDVEDGKRQGGVNEEAETEKKKEQEDYEKKIGYLVYLGQDSLEASKQKPWYAKIDRDATKSAAKDGEEFNKIKTFENSGYLEGHTKDCKLTADEVKLVKFKSFHDPLKDIKRYLKCPGIAKQSEHRDKQKHINKTPLTSTTSVSRKRRLSEESLISSSKPKKLKKEKKSKKSKKHKKSKHKKRSNESKKRGRTLASSTSELVQCSSSSGSEENSEDESKRKAIEELRAQRLQREREERRKTEQLLARLRGDKIVAGENDDKDDINSNKYRNPTESTSSGSKSNVKQRYNSQFNPELARQNYDFR